MPVSILSMFYTDKSDEEIPSWSLSPYNSWDPGGTPNGMHILIIGDSRVSQDFHYAWHKNTIFGSLGHKIVYSCLEVAPLTAEHVYQGLGTVITRQLGGTFDVWTLCTKSFTKPDKKGISHEVFKPCNSLHSWAKPLRPSKDQSSRLLFKLHALEFALCKLQVGRS